MNPLASVRFSGRNEAAVEDYGIHDAAVLEYASRILLEEDDAEKTFVFSEPSLLEAAERSLYEAIGEMYVPSPDHRLLSSFPESFDEVSPEESGSSSGVSNFGDALVGISGGDFIPPASCYYSSSATEEDSSPFWSSGGGDPELSGCSGGINDDAIEFLPWDNNNLLKKEASRSSAPEREREDDSIHADGPHRKKNPLVEEDMSRKQLPRYSELGERSEIFDKILLCSKEHEATLREAFKRMVLSERKQSKGSSTKVNDTAKKGRQRSGGVVDLQTLLTLCAQAISTDDQRGAANLLKQIRQHASPMGDGMQRLAYFFANGLKARLAGYGTEICKCLVESWALTDKLKFYHLIVAICPFRKAADYFSNKTIVNLAEKSNKVHVIDFGNPDGFQWPCLIQRLSYLPGGPPKLRLTAIDLPQPGFRPAERLEAIGHLLVSYAETFKVPFKYEAIAAKWEEVKIEDIRIETDEVTIVNCIYNLEKLLDESVVEESPRDVFLNLARKINPRVFIQGTVNGGHGSPFFMSRFREALFHFSAIFDILDVTVPRDNPERILLEREAFGQQLMNLLACEGPERIDRPETYKKWHRRYIRAGFVPLPLDREIVDTAKDTIVRRYHKDFEIEEDGCWLLQGWKGRIVHGLSTWKPATSG